MPFLYWCDCCAVLLGELAGRSSICCTVHALMFSVAEARITMHL